MSYIQIQTPDGKTRGLKFNVLAIRQFLSRIDAGDTLNTMNYAMVWGGLYANCYVKSEEVDFTFEQVCDWVDAMTQEDVDRISLVLAEVEAYKKMFPQPREEDKKKITKKKAAPRKSTSPSA